MSHLHSAPNPNRHSAHDSPSIVTVLLIPHLHSAPILHRHCTRSPIHNRHSDPGPPLSPCPDSPSSQWTRSHIVTVPPIPHRNSAPDPQSSQCPGSPIVTVPTIPIVTVPLSRIARVVPVPHRHSATSSPGPPSSQCPRRPCTHLPEWGPWAAVWRTRWLRSISGTCQIPTR